MARLARSNADPTPSGTPTHVLHAVDGWLRDTAIRRTLLIAFLATLLTTLATLVFIATLSGLALLGLIAGPTASLAYHLTNRRNRRLR
jgi:hypothetical protein